MKFKSGLKIVLLTFIIAFVYSCTITYNGEEKLIFRGNVVDRNGEPIENINVELIINGSFYDTDYISQMTTNNQGKFELLIPSPNADYEIRINNNGANNFTAKHLYNIKKENLNKYLLQLDNLVLFDKNDFTLLNVYATNINPENHIIYYKMTALQDQDYIDYNFETPEPDLFYYFPYQYSLAKNQTAILDYKVQNYTTNIITTYQIPISIGNDPVDYNFTY